MAKNFRFQNKENYSESGEIQLISYPNVQIIKTDLVQMARVLYDRKVKSRFSQFIGYTENIVHKRQAFLNFIQNYCNL